MNKSQEIIKTFGDCGVIMFSRDEQDCKQKLVELGLLVPNSKNDCLLFGREGQEAMYFFICYHDPFGTKTGPHYIGCRFDFVTFQNSPLRAVYGAREACAFVGGAIADLAGLDLAKGAINIPSAFDN